MGAASDIWERSVRGGRGLALVLMAGASLAACATAGGPPATPAAHNRPPASGGHGTMRPYQVGGVWYTPRLDPNYDETGLASWYGAQFHNRATADGELFDMDQPSGAHKTLPLPCIVEVTNLENGRRLRVRINDRGPFVQGRILDLSREAAKELGFYDKGTARVRVRYVGPADGSSYAAARPKPALPPAIAVRPPADDPPPYVEAAAHAAPPRWAIQAGAFSDRANAERAAQRLATQGDAEVQAAPRGDGVLYKVVVHARPGDDAETLRARIEAAGFPGAKVVGPS